MTGKNQHFIPQYYLRTFAQSDRLFVFDKSVDRYLGDKRIPVNKIGSSKNFYEIDPEELSKYLVSETSDPTYVDALIERYNERISAPLIYSFIELGDMVYKHRDGSFVSLIRSNDLIDFLIVQLFRTPVFRKQFEFIARRIGRKYLADSELIREGFVERFSRVIHGVYIISAICNTDIWRNSKNGHLIKPLYRFVDAEVIDKIEQMRKMSKTLWVSALDSYFITSDNPIVIKQSDKGEIQNLFFPLTKRCSVTFWCEKSADKNLIIIDEKKKDVLLEHNRIMKDRAYRFVYSCNMF